MIETPIFDELKTKYLAELMYAYFLLGMRYEHNLSMHDGEGCDC